MKNLKQMAMNLGVIEVLSREQMQNVFGAYVETELEEEGGGGGRCSNDRFCSMYQVRDGGCSTMQTGQCRCVKYANGSAVESVPDSNCLA